MTNLYLSSPQSQLSLREAALIQPALSVFLDNLSNISPLLGREMEATTTELNRLVPPSDRKTQPPTRNARLPDYIAAQRASIAKQQQALSTTHLALTSVSAQYLQAYRALLTAIIESLERTLHGSLARHVRARAEQLSLVALGMAQKSSILRTEAMRDLYPPEAVEALRAYSVELGDVRGRIGERMRNLEDVLAEYEGNDGEEDTGEEVDGKGRAVVMVEIARRYRRCLAELEVVKKEVERLEEGR